MSYCRNCQNERYIAMGCCSGRECGCMGQAIAIANCKECNPVAAIPMSDGFQREYGHLEYLGVEHENLGLLEVVK